MATDNQIINAQIKRRKIATYSLVGAGTIDLTGSNKSVLTIPKLVIAEQTLRERLWTELDNRYGDIDQDWFDKLINKVKEI
jgi:hypothetical protein